MKIRTTVILLLCAFMGLAGLLQAQTASHYPAGAEGIKGPQLPPPGLYLRDYNYIYFADKFEDGPPDFDINVYVQAPRLVWITNYQILGGFYGMDTILPFAYQDLEFNAFVEFSDSDFSFGDIFVEPITISWHQPKFDAAVGYGFWAPTGDFDQTNPISPGKGYWTQMLTGGITYYPDADKKWALSALNRYEFNQKNEDTGVTPGQYWTVDFAVGRSVTPTFEVGLSGYHQMATTAASNDPSSLMKDYATALGPEVTFAFPQHMFFISARYMREVGADNRPEGNTINITFTKGL
ncbi:MAG: transporter [Acidobacteriota bacterium]